MIRRIYKMIKKFFDTLFSKKNTTSFVSTKKQKAKSREKKWNDPFFAMSRIGRLKGDKRESALIKYKSMPAGRKVNPII